MTKNLTSFLPKILCPKFINKLIAVIDTRRISAWAIKPTTLLQIIRSFAPQKRFEYSFLERIDCSSATLHVTMFEDFGTFPKRQQKYFTLQGSPRLFLSFRLFFSLNQTFYIPNYALGALLQFPVCQ